MPTSSFTKFNTFVEDLGRKVHNLHTDVLKFYLSNTAPNVATNKVKADLAEIAAGNGYVAGGVVIPGQSYAQTAGVAKLNSTTDPVIAASGGPIGPFQYVVLQNSTAAGGPLIGYYNYGAPLTLNDGEPLNIDLDQVNGIFTNT